MKIGIMGAMIDEIALLKSELLNSTTEIYGEREYHSGRLYGMESVLSFSRWGKVASSITATTLITQYKVDCLVFTGVAGAAATHLNIGDIVIGDNLYQHDMDARPIFKQHEIPLTGKVFFEADKNLIAKAHHSANNFVVNLESLIQKPTLATFAINKPSVYIGKIASGDAFISSKIKTDSLMTEMPDVLAVEMEGAAVAQVCSDHKIPFVIIRTISDKADHSAAIDFQKFVTEIARYYSKGIIENLCGHLIPAT